MMDLQVKLWLFQLGHQFENNEMTSSLPWKPRSPTHNSESSCRGIRSPVRLTDTRRRRHLLMKTVWEHFDTLAGNRLAVWESWLLKNHTLHGPTCYFYASVIRQRRSAQRRKKMKEKNTLYSCAINGAIKTVGTQSTIEKLAFVNMPPKW